MEERAGDEKEANMIGLKRLTANRDDKSNILILQDKTMS
jgi:hypothetical protein